ncbi:chemotaxis protein CheB [Pinibacter aurantiacus]|uniref:Chemotaxis protein CheB n=1 Tax=Pinibacter aurantiacus TaxID=2851599 RepID=A0A9E2S795_9BACT|nr:chemotaxis protein CheB [Pinibacter aurantiacus]MBV4355779.1 chemotaxis protein CheB [Pinibacter aurantiacus]
MEENKIKPAENIVIIGGSAGSLDIILKIVPGLQQINAAIIMVLHRKSSSDTILVDLLTVKTKLKVKEAEEKEMIVAGCIYIAPADYHLLIEKDCTFSLDVSEKINYSRPSIDVTFESASEVYGPHLTGILLSGANADGADGLGAIKQNNGICIAQDPSTAEVPYMPQYAIDHVAIDHILTAEQIKDYINNIV